MKFNILRFIVRALVDAFDAEAAEGNIRLGLRERIVGSDALNGVIAHVNEIALVPAKTLENAGYKGELVKLFGVELIREASKSDPRIKHALANYGGYLSAVLDGLTIQEVMNTTEPLIDLFKDRALLVAKKLTEPKQA